jgi:hypothetical protein
MAVALGGDCLADVAVLREQPELAGPVASDPVVSRLAAALAADGPRALKAIRAPRAAAPDRAWTLAGQSAPGADGGLVMVDLDATIVIAHSQAAGRADLEDLRVHPMTAWVGHGAAGAGEPLAIRLRPGNAGNTAADHIEATRLALEQLPRHLRRRVVVRADSGGGTHEFLNWLTARSRRLRYPVGMTITEDVQTAIGKIPGDAWTPTYDGDGEVRDGFTDVDGHRFTVFATDAKRGQLADLELRHRRRARCEDPVRQGHRAAEPAAEGLRAEPAVVRDRRAGLRAAGLDADARPHRGRPPLGAETGPSGGSSPSRDDSSAAAAACGGGWQTAGPGPATLPPQGPPVRLTSPNRTIDQEGDTTRDRGTPPADATAGQPGTA